MDKHKELLARIAHLEEERDHWRNNADNLLQQVSDMQALRHIPIPTQREIADALMYYRHDVGLLPDAERKALQYEAVMWLGAWRKALQPSS